MPTKIEWVKNSDGTSGETWNPVTGCTQVSAGCAHCYAARMARRLAGRCGYPEAPHHFDVTLHPDRLNKPLHWRKPVKIFVVSMGDLFHDDVPFDFIDKVMYTASQCPQHTFMFLTKRPKRMFDYFYGKNITDYHPIKNLRLGVTAENQEQADKRISILLRTLALEAVYFVSVEPMLEQLNLLPYLPHPDKQRALSFVICGGETSPHARPMHPEWPKSLLRQCQLTHTPYTFKHWGEWLPHPNYGDVAPEGKWSNEKLSKFKSIWLTTAGNVVEKWTDAPSSSTHQMYHVGRKNAGRWLNGREWDECPTVSDIPDEHQRTTE